MDFGLMGIDGLVEQHQVLEGKPKCNGSGSIKQERSDPFNDEDNRVLDSKIQKRVDDLGLRSDNNSFPKQQMLSFSSSTKPELSFFNSKDVGLTDKNAQNFTFSCYQQSPHSRSLTGFGSGNINGGMHGSFNGIRGPFTPAQWIELEHQAMIYKYFTANVPVPAYLLIPIRKALSSSGFPGFSVGSYPAHSYGWGSFHLGFSGSTDPEPGRCRRTDGKKWRCSRDAVPDQKYCERHINRGRHRSRKPVEGHTGQAASGPTSTNMKGVPALPASMSSLVTSHGSASNSVTIAQHQIKSLQPPTSAANVSGDSILNRLHDQQGLSVMPPPINWQSKDSTSSVPKQLMSMGDSLQLEFGLVPNDSLLNPSHKSGYLGCKSYNSLMEFNTQQSQDQYPLRDFMDNQSSRSAIPWPEEVKSDWPQLSMSVPMSSGLSSSASTSPNQDKMTISPLRLTSVLELSKTGFPIMDDEMGTKQNAWKIPIAWGNNTMGGPLGEVLNSANNAMGSCKSAASHLNLKGDGGWDGTGSPQLGASPTGVLHNTFVSLSNSSSGGSPRRDGKKSLEGVSL